jgi:serine/threonine-protein kinase RsbW
MSSSAVWEMALTSDPARLPEVRAGVRGWLRQHGWVDEPIEEIVLALDEALANVIRHGYGGQAGHKIQVSFAPIAISPEGEGVEIRVRDFGQQVDPDSICGRALSDVRPGGLGVHLIKTLTSWCEYQRAEGGGMLLTMRKPKTHRAAACPGRRPDE